MKKVNSILSLLIVLLLLSACARKQYAMKSANGYLVEMNNRFDDHPDPAMLSFVQSYKSRLDAEMNEVIGEAAQTLTKTGTQSVLANFTADAMLEYATGLCGTVDFAVINNGGLRMILNQGAVTVGNMYEIYAFENRLVLLELPGKAVKQLFDGFAQSQKSAQGFSKSVRLTLKNNAIESLTIGGKPLDENATYKVVTVDYLAEGNSGMEAFTQATRYTDLNTTLRNAMIEYVKKLTAENKKIYAELDDRIEIKE
ncbi:MAG: 5'-nucleotidase C-terminal domain-containing protein [Candidatus Azobacteroides sp.]|nr:5'-nucleotidase C-terminal domain-containing protein [Candidatus Azobacteroides sp.]